MLAPPAARLPALSGIAKSGPVPEVEIVIAERSSLRRCVYIAGSLLSPTHYYIKTIRAETARLFQFETIAGPKRES